MARRLDPSRPSRTPHAAQKGVGSSWWIVLIAILLAALAGWALVGSERPTPAVTSRVPGIVFFCIDTLRRDTGAATHNEGGVPPGRIPALERFAEKATSFEGTLAACSWTGPSVATALTGLHPWTHGVLTPSDTARIPASVLTLASHLKEAGFYAAGVSGGAWLSAGAGLPAGFDAYADDFDRHPAAEVIRRFEDRRPLDRPFFLFLHTYAAHHPYGEKKRDPVKRCAPELEAEAYEVAELLGDIDPAAVDEHDPRANALQRLRHGNPCGAAAIRELVPRQRLEAVTAKWDGWIDGAWQRLPGGPEAVAYLRERYFGPGFAHVDARVQETLDAIAGLPKDTLVVIFSDHGECLGEHGIVNHGRFLYPELIRVHLYIKGRGFPAGLRLAGSCGLVDLAPTLLEVAGVPPLRPMEGRSLIPLVRNGGEGWPIGSMVAVGPNRGESMEATLLRASVRDATYTWSGTYSVAIQGYAEEHWFHRPTDPNERTPIAEPPTPPSSAFLSELARVRAAVETVVRFGPGSGPGGAAMGPGNPGMGPGGPGMGSGGGG